MNFGNHNDSIINSAILHTIFQPTIACSKLTIGTLEQGVKSIQS